MEARPLIAIVGPTASGKTALAVELAEKYGGEIICADSRTVYRSMDIGTAKPTLDEKHRVPHWGLDLVDPGQTYTAAEFKDYTDQKIAEIRSRGHIPFLVGGTGLYVDAVLFDYEFGDSADPARRRELEQMNIAQLQELCRENDVPLPENDKNKRHLIRAIERGGSNNRRRSEPVDNSFIVGITTDREELRRRIEHRARQMFAEDVIREAEKLAARYGWDHESMTGNIYPICHLYLEGKLSLDEAVQKFVVQDWRLAKRQLTWFKRNKFISWLSLDEAESRITSVLDSEH